MNAALNKDAYKVFHPFAYNPKVTHVFSNMTPRFGKHSNVKGNEEVLFVGLQPYLLETLVNTWNRDFFWQPKDAVCGDYQRVVSAMLGKTVPVDHIEALHDLGYLPICVKALPEGSLVPYNVPVYTIFNTVEGFGWVTNMLETDMSAETWGIMTSATTAFAYRKRFEQEPELKASGMIKFMGHDFSYRGMFGRQAAAMSGFGHLCSFVGSDTIPAALYAEKYYGAQIDKELVFASVDATEHSIMCSYGTEGELESLRHLIEDVTPSGIISIVSDTWDFWKLVTEYLPSLKDKIMTREGTVVIRPDSGDPVKILTGYTFKSLEALSKELELLVEDFVEPWELHKLELEVEVVKTNGKYFTYSIEYTAYPEGGYSHEPEIKLLEEVPEHEVKGLIQCLYETFGGTATESGLIALDSHIGAIYGDSITLERQDQIIKRLKAKGFLPSVVLGIGSFTYQYVTRDTHGTAVKATDTQHGTGNHVAISKDPKTDSSKKSAKGLLMVVKDENGRFQLKADVTPEEEASEANELKVVYENGKEYNLTTLAEIRERVDSYFA